MRERNLALIIFDGLMMFITALALVALIFAFLASTVNPNTIWWLSFFGLIAPAIFVVNIILLFYWGIRFHWFGLIPLAILIFGSGVIGRQFQLPISKQYSAETPSGTLKVISYNVHAFRDMQWNNSLDSILAFVEREDPDILCLQEALSAAGTKTDTLASLLPNMPHMSHYYTIIRDTSGNHGYGLVIFSKYVIRNRHGENFPDSNNGFIQGDIVVRNDTIRLFNLHLQSTDIDDRDKELISQTNVSGGKARGSEFDKFKNIARKLKHNYSMRATQADSIAQRIEDSPYRVIVCGDFNDIPSSYTYRKVRKGLSDTFKEKGRGYGYSYKEFYKLLKIDYIFHSDGFETISYSSPDLPWSDHNPIVATMLIETL